MISTRGLTKPEIAKAARKEHVRTQIQVNVDILVGTQRAVEEIAFGFTLGFFS